MEQKESLSPLPKNNFAKELSISQGKVPPNAVEFEKLILGASLIDKKGLDEATELLTAEMFYDGRHQEIFKAILSLMQKNSPVDMVTVINELKRTGQLGAAGGDHYIIDLTTGISSSAHIEYYVRIVQEKHILRSLITISSNVIDSSYKESTDVFELLDESEKGFFEITNATLKKGFDTAGTLVQQAVEKINALRDQEGISGIPSGFRDIDKETGGWQNTDLIIVAARPAMGKTAFILSMARNITIGHQIPMALFSLEMASVQLITRLIASELQIPSEKLRKGNMTDEEWQRLMHNLTELENAPLYVDETPALSIFDFRAKCRRLVMQHGVKIIMVDYLQLMTAHQGKGGGNREQEIATISRSLKAIAKELNVPIIALSQLSRSVEARPNKRPQLSDLRESGAIEQDADIVSFLYRPEYYKIDTWEDETPSAGQAELIIAKHRNGAVTDVRLSFQSQFAKFSDLNLFGNNYDSFSAPRDEGYSTIKTTANPSEAFGMNTPTNISASSMNYGDDDLPF